MKKWFKSFIIAIPFIEIALFILVGQWLGLGLTLLLIVLTSIAGLALFRHQNTRMRVQMQTMFQSGMPPMMDMTKNSFMMFAAILLIVPGFFTGFLGILCLIPQIRGKLARLIFGFKVAKPANDPHTFEGECWEEGKDKLPKD